MDVFPVFELPTITTTFFSEMAFSSAISAFSGMNSGLETGLGRGWKETAGCGGGGDDRVSCGGICFTSFSLCRRFSDGVGLTGTRFLGDVGLTGTITRFLGDVFRRGDAASNRTGIEQSGTRRIAVFFVHTSQVHV